MIRRLSIFTRHPTPGQTKTRLIPVLGARGAAELHDRMTRQVLAQARGLDGTDPCANLPGVELEVCFTGGDVEAMASWLGAGPSYVAQARGNLGQRMLAVFERAADDRVDATVLVGTDLPRLRTAHLARAFERLARHDLVLGPTADGGYYLIGLRRPVSSLFDGVTWGSGEVLDQTLARASEAALTVAQLEQLRDLDRPEDLDDRDLDNWDLDDRGPEPGSHR